MRRPSKVLLVAGIFLAGLFLLSGTVFAQQTRIFENKQLKYSVKYPADYVIKPLGRVIVFISPEADKKTGFAENVNIAVEPLPPPGMKLDDLFEQSKEKLKLGGKGVKILEEKKEKLSQADAYRIVYTSKQKKTNFKQLQVIAIHKNRVYAVIYTALAEQFDRGLNAANSIIKSLKFTD
jgi:hypothetical protein